MMVPDSSNPNLTSSLRLFYGPPGTGKSLAAQAIGFEVGGASHELELGVFERGFWVRDLGCIWNSGKGLKSTV